MFICSSSLESERINNHTSAAWASTHAQAPRRNSWRNSSPSLHKAVCVRPSRPPWQTMSRDSWAINWKWWIKPQIYLLPLMSGSVKRVMGERWWVTGVVSYTTGWRCRQLGVQFKTVCHGLNRLMWQCETFFQQWSGQGCCFSPVSTSLGNIKLRWKPASTLILNFTEFICI